MVGHPHAQHDQHSQEWGAAMCALDFLRTRNDWHCVCCKHAGKVGPYAYITCINPLSSLLIWNNLLSSLVIWVNPLISICGYLITENNYRVKQK